MLLVSGLGKFDTIDADIIDSCSVACGMRTYYLSRVDSGFLETDTYIRKSVHHPSSETSACVGRIVPSSCFLFQLLPASSTYARQGLTISIIWWTHVEVHWLIVLASLPHLMPYLHGRGNLDNDDRYTSIHVLAAK